MFFSLPAFAQTPAEQYRAEMKAYEEKERAEREAWDNWRTGSSSCSYCHQNKTRRDSTDADEMENRSAVKGPPKNSVGGMVLRQLETR